MSITVTVLDPAMPQLPDEKAVIVNDEDGREVYLHPWDRPGNFQPREVYIAVGQTGAALDDERDRTDEFESVIVNREDFIEAVLAVFPELRRA